MITTVKKSVYQEAIIKEAQEGEGNLVVEAVPGSGKSTTLKMITEALPNLRRVLLVAFNTHIAKELKHKVKCEVRTVHSLGLSFFPRRPEVQANKYRKLCSQWIHGLGIQDKKQQNTLSDGLFQLVNFARLYNLNSESSAEKFLDVLDISGVDLTNHERKLLPGVPEILAEGIKDQSIIDYTDMLWMPVQQGWISPYYRMILVDEAQDMSAIHLEILTRCVLESGRLIFVGDRNQSIYGFAGADHNSIPNIIAKTNAKTLPLSICYRCPKSHIRLAQEIVPHVEWAENAIEGEIHYIEERDVKELVQKDDLLISRCTAPLVKICLELILAGQNARIRGGNLGETFRRILEGLIDIKGFNYQRLPDTIAAWAATKVAELKDAGKSALEVETIWDMANTLTYLWETLKSPTLYSLITEIEELFDERKGADIWLSTVHRAKGLEANRVFIIRPELMPHPLAKGKDELQQEKNLKFVALTRAKKSLFFVTE